MKNVNYDSFQPIKRLEKGDKAIIKVRKFSTKEKDKIKYKDVPNGSYEAVCTKPFYLECKEYPVLSGRYTFWYGNKWGCTKGIYADEVR